MKSIYKYKFSISRFYINFSSFLVLFSFILGSGVMKIQVIGLALVILSFCELMYSKANRKKLLNSSVLLFYFYLISSITISAVISATLNVTLDSIITYNFSIYFFLFLYFYAAKKQLFVKKYEQAAVFFSVIVIILTVLGLFNIPWGKMIQKKVLSVLSGMDGQKPIAGIIFQGFYLQGTLAIVPAAVSLMYQKKWESFVVCFSALALALSRWSLITIILCYGLMNYKKTVKLIIVIILFFALGFIANIPIIMSLLDIFSGKDDGMSIRTGHLLGIIEILSENPMYFFIGQGPGSLFYSYGFHKFTSTVEISQFDFLRKYGIFTTIVFSLFLLLLSFMLIKKTDDIGKSLGWGILAHFIVSISNPVLLSLPFMSFLAISCAYYQNYMKRMRWKN